MSLLAGPEGRRRPIPCASLKKTGHLGKGERVNAGAIACSLYPHLDVNECGCLKVDLIPLWELSPAPVYKPH